MNAGVPQEYILSPILFNVYINDLIEKVEKIKGTEIYCYADDMVVIGDTRRLFEQAIKKIESWCKKNKMGLNKDKSQIL